MRAALLTAAVWFAGLAPATAQETDPPAGSLVPVDARYEIVQSPINLRDTFRLDRWSGGTAVLLESPDDGSLVWRQIPMDSPPTATPSKPRFQLSLSGVAAKGTYLIDTATGESWVLVGKEPPGRWVPIR